MEKNIEVITENEYVYTFGNNKQISFRIHQNNELIIQYNKNKICIPGKMAREYFFHSKEYVPTDEDIAYLFNDNIEIPDKLKSAKKVRLMLKFTPDHELSNLSSFFVKWKESDVWDRYPFTMLNMDQVSIL